eukprot:TRINITY_DN31107_c0_g1_i1.p1 TRINITY_DN31107_c0_g1~~TRINITY_DN31107_c0_g1_i1.p1  ORF type:complete len:370 (+),score=152.32 TRINITY_DN31107_c0_g1_i1:104-1213(+)
MKALVAVLLFLVHVSAFLTPPPALTAGHTGRHSLSTGNTRCVQQQKLELYAKKKGRMAKGKILENLREEEENDSTATPAAQEDGGSFDKSKLAAEVSTPFRTLRLFIYGAFATSALIGGLTACTQLAASVANQPDALPLSQCLLNVGVDFGVVGVCVYAYNFENKQRQGLVEQKRAEREQAALRKQSVIPEEVTKSRVERLRELQIRLTVSESETKNVPLGVLMQEAKQDVVLVAGGKEMLRDAMLRATVNREIFTANNLLIVPVQVADPSDPTAAVTDKGFGAKPAYFKQGFVGEPAEEDEWRALVAEEIRDADRQGNSKAAKQGVVLVVSRDGKVLRRGLGMPKWDMIRQDLYPNAKVDDMGRRVVD